MPMELTSRRAEVNLRAAMNNTIQCRAHTEGHPTSLRGHDHSSLRLQRRIQGEQTNKIEMPPSPKNEAFYATTN